MNARARLDRGAARAITPAPAASLDQITAAIYAYLDGRITGLASIDALAGFVDTYEPFEPFPDRPETAAETIARYESVTRHPERNEDRRPLDTTDLAALARLEAVPVRQWTEDDVRWLLSLRAELPRRTVDLRSHDTGRRLIDPLLDTWAKHTDTARAGARNTWRREVKPRQLPAEIKTAAIDEGVRVALTQGIDTADARRHATDAVDKAITAHSEHVTNLTQP